MKKKGFTLIEILTVIVLLGIIMLIVAPNIMNIYMNSKEKKFKINIEKLFKATEVYKSEYELLYGRALRNTTIEIIDNKIAGNPLSLKGRLPESGTILIDQYGRISIVAYDGGLCGEKLYSDAETYVTKVSKEECELYNVRGYEIYAGDFSIIKGEAIDLRNYAYLSRYNQKIENVEISYTSIPTFDFNTIGDYEVTYSAFYNEKNYTKTITVRVKENDPHLQL